MSQVRRLGMGLGALLGGEGESSQNNEQSGAIEVSLIRPNPFQPRAEFDEAEIASLAESLKRQGVLQPVVVRPAEGGFYELVAGERRWRASRKAGFDRIPAVIREVDDRRMLEMALVENLQRRDLNPLEKARAFRQLMQLNSWTQEEVADAVGLGRPTVANFIRLLELPPEIQEAVSRGTITMGHARALLGVSPRSAQLQLLRRILEEDLSVRALEKLARRRSEPSSEKGNGSSSRREPYLEELERKLMDRLGVRVEIMPEAIVIPYGSNQQLTAILKRLGVL
ncbi:MAG TPA: ParB/RepB/Spo0J family partition protein [Planctomycetota bacterium]|nr:ParB/RepB/Spo0J family partition protein [Planctomycetota bacterium]